MYLPNSGSLKEILGTRDETVSLDQEVLAHCFAAKQLEDAGDYEAARLELSEDLGLLLHADRDPPAVPSQTHSVAWVLIGTPQVLPVDFAARALRGSSVRSATPSRATRCS